MFFAEGVVSWTKRDVGDAGPYMETEACAMELPKRKQIRLPDYDYSSPGAYFVTICTHERRCILSDVTVGAAISRPPELHFTAYGEIVDSAIKSISSIYPAVFIDNYV